MTAPRTRLDEGATDFERDLLRSWKNEAPSSQTRQNVIGLGVAGALAAVTSTATATGAAGTAIVEGLAPKATAVAMFAIGKWIVAGAVVVSGAVFALPYVRSPASTPADDVSHSLPSPAWQPHAVPPPDPPSEPAAQNEVLAVPTPLEMPPAAPTTTGARSAVTRPVSRLAHSGALPDVAPPDPSEAKPTEEKHSARGLGEQVVSLDRAESTLATGNAAEALRMIEDYESRFPTGSLLQEAMILRIEALSKMGKGDEASALAERFLALHPASPYAAKLRRRLESGSNR